MLFVTIRPFYALALAGLLVLPQAAQAASPTITIPNANLGAYSLGTVQIPLRSTGGTGAVTWTVTAGSLPPGLAIRTDGTSSFPGDTTGSLMGVATAANHYSFTLTATDSANNSADFPATIDITNEYLDETFSVPDGAKGVAYSHQLNVVNGTAPSFSVVSGNLPGTFSLSSGGLLTGAPTAAGTYNFKVQISDSGLTFYRSLNLTVAGPTISTGISTVVQGGAAPSPLTGAGGNGGPYTFQLVGGSLPGGLALQSTGSFTGTVNQNANVGRFSFSVNVSDGSGTYRQNLAIYVTSATTSTLPFITQPFMNDATIGNPYIASVSGGSGKGPYTWSVTGLPTGLTFRTQGLSSSVTPGDVEIRGVPQQFGDFNVIFTATDQNNASVTQTLKLHVSKLAVTNNLTLPNGTLNSAYAQQNMQVVGGTPGYTTLLPGPGFPQNGINVSGGGATGFTISGTPTETGTVNFPIRISDSGGETFMPFVGLAVQGSGNITINNNSNLGTFSTGSNVNYFLNACCVQGGHYTWTNPDGQMPSGLSLNASTGQLGGTATPTGGYSFRIRATDQGNSSNFGEKIFTIGFSDLAITTASLPFGNVGTPYNFTITTSGGDQAHLTWFNPNGLLPPGLSYSNGVFSGTPTSPGQYNFAISLVDDLDNFIQKNFSLVIYPAGSGPSVSITSPGALGVYPLGDFEYDLTDAATGGTGSFTWTLESGSLPPGVAIRDFSAYSEPAALAGVANTPGDYTFTLRATSGPSFATKQFSVRITALNLMDGFSLPDAYDGAAYSYTLTPVNNAGVVSYSVTGGALPAWATLTNGTISGTPTGAGSANFSIMYSDGTDAVTRSFTLTTNKIHISNSPRLPNMTQGQSYSVGLNTTGGTGEVTFQASGLPNGLQIQGGAIVGTVDPNAFAGLYTVRLTATDSATPTPASTTQTFSINVTATNAQLPRISYGTPDDAVIGMPYSWTFNPCCGGEAPFTWSAQGLPAGLAIRYDGSGTPGTASGSPSSNIAPGAAEIYGAAKTAGPKGVTLTMTDSLGQSTSVSFVLNVSILDVQPSMPNGTLGQQYGPFSQYIVGGAANPNYGGTSLSPAGGALDYFGAAPGFPVNGGWSSQLGGLPDGLLVTADGNPPVRVTSGAPVESGSFAPVYVVNDGNGNTLRKTNFFSIDRSSGSTVSINTNANLGGIAPNTDYSYQLSASGAASITWSQVGGTLPPGLTLTADGALMGQASTPGNYSFLVRAEETGHSENTDSRAFTLVVTPIAITTNSLPFGTLNAGYSGSLSATGGTGTLTWAVGTGSQLPPGLSLDSATGALSGTLSSTGQYFTVFTVMDSIGNRTAKSLAINVFPEGGGPPISISTGSDMGTWSIGETQLELQATGGTGAYAWSLQSGTLPPGFSIRTDKPSWFSGAASAGLIGVGTTPGTYTFTLKAASGQQNATRQFTMKIVSLTMKDPFSLADAYVGNSYSYSLTPLNAAQASTPVFSTTQATCGGSSTACLPPGLILGTDGSITGNPTTAGSYSFNVSVDDGTAKVTRQFNIQTYAIDITTTSLPNATQGTAYDSGPLTATGGGTIVWSASSLPPGFSINSATGAITTAANFQAGPGRNSVTVTATSGNVSSVHRFLLDIVGVPATLPQLALNGAYLDDATVGWPYQATFAVNNGGRAPFTYSATGLPPGMSIRSANPVQTFNNTAGDAEIWGVASAPGSFDVTITATDANNFSTSTNFKLNVSPLMQDPGLPKGTIGTGYNSNIRIVGGSGSYSVTKTVTGFLPAGLVRTGMNVAGTPTESGNFSVTYAYADTSAPNAATLAHTNYFGIDNTLNNPVGINTPSDLGTITVNTPFNRTLNACCSQSGFTWVVANGSALPHGLTLGSGGLLSGTPDTSGSYSFVISATDGASHTAARQFYLNVTPINLSTNTNLSYGTVGTLYPTVTLTTTGAQGAVTWALNPNSYLPPGIALTGNTLSGTPTAAGHYSFTLTGTDQAATPNILVRTFSIDIYPAGSGPPLSFSLNSSYGPWAVGANSIALSATGGVPPYTFSFAPAANTIAGCNIKNGGAMPSNFSQGVTAGLLCVVTSAGSTNTTIRVTDSNSNTFDRATTITVSPLMLEMQSSLPRATVGVPYTYDPAAGGGLAATGGPNGSTYTFSATGLPGGLSINGTTGVISGTPTGPAQNFNPTITLGNLQINSGNDKTQTQVTLNVNASTISPTSLTSTAGQTFSTTFTAPSCGSGCTWNAPNGLPSGYTLNASTGVFATSQGNVTTATDTSFVVQVTGTIGNTQQTSQQVVSLVVAPNAITALSITTTIPTTAELGKAQNVGLFAAGGKPPYTFSVSAGQLPPGISLQGPGDQIGFLAPSHQYLAGRPVFASSFNFTLKVTDANSNEATQDYTWVVSPLSIQYTNLPLTNTSLIYNTPYSQLLLAMGGSGNYSGWTSQSKLQRGLTLDSSSGLLSGTPLATGQISTILSVNDDAGGAAATSVNVNVSSNGSTTLSLGGPASPTVQALGFTGVYNLNPNGGTGPYTLSSDSLPPGVILESGSSLASNTGFQYGMQVTFSTPGTYSFTVKAVDSSPTPLTGARSYTISVPDFAQPILTALPPGSKDVAYSQQLYSFGNGTWAVDAGSALPPGLSISAAGVISGTPTSTGVYAFSLTVSDVSGTLHQSFTMQISPLSISSTQTLPPAAVGIPYGGGNGVQLAASGGTGTTTWALASGQLPDGLTLSGAGLISGTPTGNNSSTFYAFTATATNTSGQIARQFSIFQTLTNPLNLDYPIFQTFMNDATVGQNYVWTLQPDGGVPDYTWTVANGSTLPGGLHLVPATLVSTGSGPGVTAIAGTPTTPGLFTFDLVLTDSTNASITRTFTLNVTPLSITRGNPRDAVQDQPYSFQLQATGGTGPYTFELQANPNQWGQDLLPPGLTMDSTGLISGTARGTGSFQFVVKVTDSAQSQHNTLTRFLSISSNLGNESIQARNQDFNLNSPINVLLGVSGSAATYNWTVEAPSPAPASPVQPNLPSGVQLVSNQGGTSIQGPATAPGTYTFVLKATNAGNPTDVVKRQLTLRITPLSFVAPVQNGLFSPTLPIATVGTPYSFTLKAAGGSGAYTFSRAPNAPMPPGLGIDINGVISGTPTQSGIFNLHPWVADNAGDPTDVNLGVTLVVLAPGGHAPLNLQSKIGISDPSIGVPFSIMLDRLVTPATGPLTWTVPSGSLPAGTSILPGSNGLSSILAGIPTTAGLADPFTLHVADTHGQSLDIPVDDFTISPLKFTPDSIPNAVKGTSYSVFIGVQGGTAPYGVHFAPGATPPPGMSIQGGLFTGTPTVAGVFPIGLVATDKNKASVTKYYDFSVDDSNGAAPSLSVAPRPVQALEIQGQSATSTTITVNSSSGALPFTAAVYGVGGASLTTSSGTTSGSLTLDYSGLSAGNYTGFVGVTSANAVNLVDVTPVFISVLPPPPCVYLLKTSTTSSPIGGDSGTIEISTGDACSWTAAPAEDSSWITLSGPTSGTGSGKVTYTTAANGTGAARAGTVNITGSTNSPVFTINQFSTGCSFSLSPSSINIDHSGGTATVKIMASGSSCTWATGAELTVAPTTGTGTATVDVTIPQNTDALPTVRTVTIAGKTLTINQTGVNCTYSLSAHSTLFDSNGGSGSVDVTAPNGCPYSTIQGPTWINVTSGDSGTGNGSAQSLVYTVDANSTTAPRTGALIIGGQVYAITEQALACSVSVDTSQLGSPFPSGGGSGTIAITTNGPNCPWRAVSNSGFAQAILGGGLGSGTLTINVNTNVGSTTPRPGSVTISGQTINFTQAGTACTFVLRSSGSNMPPIGGSSRVGVVAPAACNWDASANDSWLHIVAKGTNGTADVLFTADANTSQTPRSGTLTVASQTFTVNEGGAPCTYTLASQNSGTLASNAAPSLTVNYTASADSCPAPVVASFSSWIGVTNSYTAPNGTVTYGIEANTAGNPRAGNIQVGDKVFRVVQNAAVGACQYSLNSYGLALNYQGTSSSFTAAANSQSCTSPPTGANQPFINTLSLTGDPTEFTESFIVDPFSSANKSVRTGYITFGGVLFYIKQTSF